MYQTSFPIEQRTTIKSTDTHFYIYGPIEETVDYIDLIHALDYAQEQDEINIHLDTIGGSLTAALAIIHAIGRTKATVITHADAEVSSAGTIIFLSGHMMAVYDYSHFMFHDGSGGARNKFNEMSKYINATVNLLGRITKDIYSKIFTQEEIERINEGVDRYMDSDEMVERLEAYTKRLQEEALESQTD